MVIYVHFYNEMWWNFGVSEQQQFPNNCYKCRFSHPESSAVKSWGTQQVAHLFGRTIPTGRTSSTPRALTTIPPEGVLRRPGIRRGTKINWMFNGIFLDQRDLLKLDLTNWILPTELDHRKIYRTFSDIYWEVLGNHLLSGEFIFTFSFTNESREINMVFEPSS